MASRFSTNVGAEVLPEQPARPGFSEGRINRRSCGERTVSVGANSVAAPSLTSNCIAMPAGMPPAHECVRYASERVGRMRPSCLTGIENRQAQAGVVAQHHAEILGRNGTKAGFTVARVTGSHHIMRHPDGRGTTIPVHQGRDVAKGTLRGILSDIDMTIEELQRLL